MNFRIRLAEEALNEFASPKERCRLAVEDVGRLAGAWDPGRNDWGWTMHGAMSTLLPTDWRHASFADWSFWPRRPRFTMMICEVLRAYLEAEKAIPRIEEKNITGCARGLPAWLGWPRVTLNLTIKTVDVDSAVEWAATLASKTGAYPWRVRCRMELNVEVIEQIEIPDSLELKKEVK